MSKLPMIARILLGLVFTVFGANKFLHFIPNPPMEGAAGDFMGGMVKSGFFIPLLAAVELVGGLLLLVGRYVPLGLTLLAGPVVGILAFHVTLAMAGLPVALVVLLLEVYLAYAYRGAFSGVLNPAASPSSTK